MGLLVASGKSTSDTLARGECLLCSTSGAVWGKEAKNFVQAVVGTLPKESRVEALQHCRRLVAHAVQSAVATQLLTAAAPWGAPV